MTSEFLFRRTGVTAALMSLALLACGLDSPAHAQAPDKVRVYAGSATPGNAAVAITPGAVTLQPGSTVQFTAAVTGTSNTSVVWQATGGVISQTGHYTAGQATGSFSITATLAGGTIAGAASVAIQPAATGTAVAPGQDIQERINSMPDGTVFRLTAGVHRLTSPLTPKSGSSIIGDPGAILSGARLLTGFQRSGSSWVVGGQTQQGEVHGDCESEYPRCGHVEDLFIDNTLLRHVGSLSEVGPGKWFFDYDNDRIYIGDDPNGKQVETSVTRYAFGGSAENVTIANLVVEKFAVPAQSGAIAGDNGRNWTVRDSEVRFNHGVGVRIGHGMKVLRNNIHRNGQMGIGGIGDDVLVEGNEIAFNNTAHFEAGWEAGGTKFVKTRNLIVRANNSHHNNGPGLWTDIDNIHTTYEDNRIEDNAGPGIFHEISYNAVIRRNTARRNGLNFHPWLLGAGIHIAASSNVEVYGNTVSDNGNGITAVQQPRGTGAHGPWVVENLWVHDNVVTMTSGMSGVGQDFGDNSYFTSRNNRFTNNTYHLGSNAAPFAWMNGTHNESSWRGFGHDTTGQFNR